MTFIMTFAKCLFLYKKVFAYLFQVKTFMKSFVKHLEKFLKCYKDYIMKEY